MQLLQRSWSCSTHSCNKIFSPVISGTWYNGFPVMCMCGRVIYAYVCLNCIMSSSSHLACRFTQPFSQHFFVWKMNKGEHMLGFRSSATGAHHPKYTNRLLCTMSIHRTHTRLVLSTGVKKTEWLQEAKQNN